MRRILAVFNEFNRINGPESAFPPMSSVKPILPAIPDADRTPLVDVLLELIQWQLSRIEQLEDDIHTLKQQTRKPMFKSSEMDKHTEPKDYDLRPRQWTKKGPKLQAKPST